MKTRASILLCLALFLTACATEKVVERPVVVHTTESKWREIPSDLTRTLPKQPIPQSLTYGEFIEVCSRDRATIDTLNGQLLGISSLSEPEDGGSE